MVCTITDSSPDRQQRTRRQGSSAFSTEGDYHPLGFENVGPSQGGIFPTPRGALGIHFDGTIADISSEIPLLR